LLKAFRVVRLLGKLVSLRRIISAVSSAFAPVCNAFFVMALVLFLFSMVGVDLFKDVSPDKFGCFSKACFTMFQGRSSFLPASLPPCVHPWHCSCAGALARSYVCGQGLRL
jgi:hypothetical protein